MDKQDSTRRLPPLNSLRAFEAAARHLSFTRAAAELFVTQAAVSHQVKALEDWLGVALFRRRNRSVFLTEAGQVYLQGVREALDGLVEATRRLQQLDTSGILTVSVLPSFAANWLVPRLGGFRARHPSIEVRISADSALVDFGRDDIDMAVRHGHGGWPNVVAIKLLSEDLFPVCSPSLLNGDPPLRRPEDLKHHTLLHDDIREDWRKWLMAAGVEGVDPYRGPGFNHSNLLFQAAIDGQGVAVGRSVLVSKDLAAGRLVKPFDIELPAEFAYYIVFPPRNAEVAKVKAFADWLIETAAAEAEDAAVGSP